ETAEGKKHALKLQDYPVLRAFVESIRATLAGDVATLERYYKIELEGNPGRWQLFLAPRERSMAQVISQIRIGGAGTRLDLIEVQEAKGDRTVTKVTEDAP
ncbi:MAG TPA: LolA-related protein, partial [Burkholderiales bacterium]